MSLVAASLCITHLSTTSPTTGQGAAVGGSCWPGASCWAAVRTRYVPGQREHHLSLSLTSTGGQLAPGSAGDTSPYCRHCRGRRAAGHKADELGVSDVRRVAGDGADDGNHRFRGRPSSQRPTRCGAGNSTGCRIVAVLGRGSRPVPVGDPPVAAADLSCARWAAGQGRVICSPG